MADVGLGVSWWNLFRAAGTSAEVHANFDRDDAGGADNVDVDDASKRGPRILRPGAIIVPNLDIDEDPGVARARFRFDEADALVDEVINKGDDEFDTTQFILKEPDPVVGNSDKLVLKLAAKDAARVRIFQVPYEKTIDEAVQVLGAKIGAAPNVLEFEFYQENRLEGMPDDEWEVEFYIEALALAGDPNLTPATGDPIPPPPGPLSLPAPDAGPAPGINVADLTNPIYPNRAAGDVWLTIEHSHGGVANLQVTDVALFTIAPWIMTWNTLPCERVYVEYIASRTTFPDSVADNHGMVWDLQQACEQAGLANLAPKAPNADSTLPVATNTRDEIRSRNDVPFYVVPEALALEYDNPGAPTYFFGGDRWVQDEFEVGYCHSPHESLHITLHTPRNRALQTFVEEHMAHAGMGVYNGIAKGGDGVDYGGNLEVSPPVANGTPALPRTEGGPSVNAHNPAPFGKIILGDYEPYDGGGGLLRDACDPELRELLFAQHVQPVLPLDTSWLSVGHVDEFMSFVHANDGKGFRLLFASEKLMKRILKETIFVDDAAVMHAGKYKSGGGVLDPVHPFPDAIPIVRSTSATYMGTLVIDWYIENRDYSKLVQFDKLTPIRDRMKDGLDLAESDVLSIPTYFKLPTDPLADFGHEDNRTVAENVGMVNMLVVNQDLMVPRPHGPRLSPADAQTVVTNSLHKWFTKAGAGVPVAIMPSPDDHYFWARPGETVEQLAMYFARPAPLALGDPTREELREILIEKIKDPTVVLPALATNAVTALRNAILADPVNLNAPTAIDVAAPPPGRVFNTWMKVKIPDGTVDVLEAYMKSILEPLGNTVHFIENFESYHEQYGEVHCGTNAKRTPPEANVAFTDRWWDAGVYDPDFDTTYDPGA